MIEKKTNWEVVVSSNGETRIKVLKQIVEDGAVISSIPHSRAIAKDTSIAAEIEGVEIGISELNYPALGREAKAKISAIVELARD